ncbi:MAG: hypothetical protein NTZ33_00140 [Bacteroidetes bacterium]|nr:hypothetical protein [Bacteroidota bacterium]
MKTLIASIGLFILFSSIIIIAPNEYLDLNFETINPDGKQIVSWEYKGDQSIINIDTSNSLSGKNSLFVRINHPNEGAKYYILLPKVYYKGLRSVEISVNIKMPFEKPNACFWSSADIDNKYFCSASTNKSRLSPTLSMFYTTSTRYIPVMPFSWTSYSYELKIDKDPSAIYIGLFVTKDRAWFDDIKLKINGKPIHDLAFQISHN